MASITVAPGYPAAPDFLRLAVLTEVPVSLIVGERDGRWVTNAISTRDVLTELGGNVTLEIVRGAGHRVFDVVGVEKLIEAIERH